MKSQEKDWTSIFLQWDGWVGFYDDGVPTAGDQDGRAANVGDDDSPPAKPDYIDHQALISDAAVRRTTSEISKTARRKIPQALTPNPLT
jgi:hypothetical protein